MNIAELIFRRIDGEATPAHYIAWAIASLETSSEANSVWELASLSLYSFDDPDETEYLFQRCVRDLGLHWQDDWTHALSQYAKYLCDGTVSGAIPTSEVILRLTEIWSDDEVWLYGIWGQLATDILQFNDDVGACSAIKDSLIHLGAQGIVNDEMTRMDADEFVRLVAAQFIRLLEVHLPERFPFLVFCKTCGFVPIEIDHPLDNAGCSGCQRPSASGPSDDYLDMRVFQDREVFLEKELWKQPIQAE